MPDFLKACAVGAALVMSGVPVSASSLLFEVAGSGSSTLDGMPVDDGISGAGYIIAAEIDSTADLDPFATTGLFPATNAALTIFGSPFGLDGTYALSTADLRAFLSIAGADTVAAGFVNAGVTAGIADIYQSPPGFDVNNPTPFLFDMLQMADQALPFTIPTQANGDFVLTSYFPSDVNLTMVAPIPLPTAAPIFLSGLALLIVLRRRPRSRD